MTTYTRITYSRKRRALIEFDQDLDFAHNSETVPLQQPTSSTETFRAPLTKRSANYTKPGSSTNPFLSWSKFTPDFHSSKANTSQHKPTLTQLTIDLGSNPHRKCKICGMEYIQTNKEDSLLHKRFHESCLAGLEVSKKTYSTMRVVWRKQGSRVLDKVAEVVEVRRCDTATARNFAVKLLRNVEKGLGAVEIAEEVLWGKVVHQRQRQIQNCVGKLEMRVTSLPDSSASESSTIAQPRNHAATTEKIQMVTVALPGSHFSIAPVAITPCTDLETGTAIPPNGHDEQIYEHNIDDLDRYKFYLYFRDRRCIGLCLAEHIFEARRVILANSLPGYESSCIVTDPESNLPARLGVSRIWVSRDHRRAGVAMALLEAASKHFCRDCVQPKCGIAWSQPTESGTRLARKWFGKEDGWLVYDEQS